MIFTGNQYLSPRIRPETRAGFFTGIPVCAALNLLLNTSPVASGAQRPS